MAVTYTTENLRYGLDFQQTCDVWAGTNSSGNPRAAILYFHGGGWNRGDKSLIESQFHFFTSQNGSDGTDPNKGNQQAVQGLYERDEDIVVVSCNYPMQHPDSETAVGTDIPAFRRPGTGNVSMQTFIRSVHDAVLYFRTYGPAAYNIDPDKIIVAGSSAGGFNVGGAFYQSGLGHTTTYDAGNSRAQVPTVSSMPNGLVLHQAPLDLTLVPGGIYNAFSGVEDNETWDVNVIERVKRCSALRIIDHQPEKRPVFSIYDTEHQTGYTPGESDGLSGAHSPYWGVELHKKLAARGTSSHQLYVFMEDTVGGLSTATGGGSYATLYNPDGITNPNFAGTGAWPTDAFVSWLTTNGWL